MGGKEKIFVGTFAVAESLMQLTHPGLPQGCIPFSQIASDRIIYVANHPISLPEGIEVRAIFGRPVFKEDGTVLPCFENPRLMLSREIEGFNPYIMIDVERGDTIYEQSENQFDPFASLKKLLPKRKPIISQESRPVFNDFHI